MSQFVALLNDYMRERGISQLALGQLVGHANNSAIGMIISGKRKVPLAKLDHWLDAMGIDDAAERDRWWMAASEDSPHVRRLLREVDRLRRELDQQKAALEALQGDDDA